MLSLIVCSVNPNYLSQLKASVAATIGVEHEWLVWDNRQENQGLCYVYNQLAEQVRFPLMVFLHEDLIFQTGDWGKILIDRFGNNASVGLIGVAGGRYKSALYSGWYTGLPASDYYHIMHRNGKEEFMLSYPAVWEKTFEEVVNIDGVFMACRREAWQCHRFDEDLLKGFHFYDIDFSLRVAKYYTVEVTNQIEMVHLTKGGDYGEVWVQQAFLYHHARKATLPQFTGKINQADADHSVALYWLDWLKNFNIRWSSKWKWITRQRLYTHPSLWYGIVKFLVYKPLRLRAVHHFFKSKQK
jgi:hypothetical protein